MEYKLIDKDKLFEHYDGDTEILTELVGIFEETYPETISELKTAISERNFKNIELHAHTLKGMIGNFFDDTLKEKTFLLEKIGREGSGNISVDDVIIIESDLVTLIDHLKSILK